MKCDHKNCHCQSASIQSGGQNYCSQACANAARTGSAEGGCTCGHPGCH